MKENGIDFKTELRRILRYYDQRLDNCTMQEIKSVTNMLMSNMEIHGTLDDFAEFYGRSKDAVSSVIKRRMIQKPKRNVVLYPFHAFQRIIPDSWRKGH